jgi:hypothetical protein
MMKFVILSLFFFTATVTGRLRHFKGRKKEELQKTRANETFFAKNEIVPTMMVAIENEKVAPFELVNVTDSNVTLQDGRDLQSVNSVTIMNQCASQGFWLVIIYTESGTGLVKHKGWYSIPPNHQEHFNDVVDGIYSFYAVSFDRRYEWGAPNPDTAKYCFNGRCYQDYDFSDSSSSFHYLNCYGPSPTPAPMWSPTPAPVLSPTPAPIAISSRAQDWVNSHNTRRASIHSQFGKSFIALNWSDRLAYSAQGYADRLASITWSDCHIQHGYQGDSYGGENIAATWGSQSFDFPDPEDVLTQWFEDEENDPWPQNGHRTQVAWRGTGFVGCGEAKKVYNGDLYCKIQVCRYLAPGNCNVGSAGEGLDTYMMDDYTPCGPQSPYT